MEIKNLGKTFHINSKMYDKNKGLVTLILNTESMDDDERQYWFDIMPHMNDVQVERLFNILETERVKLEDIESKYQEEIRMINEKHIKELNTDFLISRV